MKENVFVCFTPYHIYIACIKAMVEKMENYEIAVTDNVPDGETYCAALRKEGVFKRVHYLKQADYIPRFARQKFHVIYFLMPFLLRRSDRVLGFLRNKEIYLFSDNSSVGIYLMRRHIPYHLLEDGCDTFSYNQRAIRGRAQKIKKLLFNLWKIPYSMGQSPYCADVEVNDKARLKTAFSCPVIEKRRSELIAQMNEEQIAALLRVFDFDFSMSLGRKSLLLLTQPLCEMRLAKDDAETVRLYEKALLPYRDSYDIYVKPHPRDKGDYTQLFDGAAVVIPRAIPAEILNYVKNIQFDLGVTLSSTSANGVSFCKKIERISLT